MKKNVLLVVLSTLTTSVLTAFVFSSNIKNTFAVKGSDNVVWYHYHEVKATSTRHGSKEFWANCSTHTFSFTEPDSSNILEGVAFDTTSYFFELDESDDRYIAPLCATPIKTGNTITYGLYPQSHISDDDLIIELENSATLFSNNWYEYNGEMYAKKALTRTDARYFDDGTSIIRNNEYWFKCEPIVWNILSSANNTYFLLSKSVLDAHLFNEQETMHWNMNNYYESEIRTFLNNEFYNSAFMFNNSYVQTTLVDNSAATTASLDNGSASDNTNDKVFLPSYQDYINTNYGFSSNPNEASITRQAYGTEYARCSNLDYYATDISSFGAIYFTRSPCHDFDLSVMSVHSDGFMFDVDIDNTWCGVRPSICISSSSVIDSSEIEKNLALGITPSLDTSNMTLTYGLYPQSRVTDSTLLTGLDALETTDVNGWYLYQDEYYAKTKAVVYNSNIYFNDGTKVTSGVTYWFKCEPINWKILNRTNGNYFLLSSSVLDWTYYGDYETDYGNVNNYNESELRAYLNNEFYFSAFSLDSSFVRTTLVDNSAATTDSLTNTSASSNTNDKVFLPSYQDYLNPNYGFSSDPEEKTTSHYAYTTEYARARGASYDSYDGFEYSGRYWTRSPLTECDFEVFCICDDGRMAYDDIDGSNGVRPSITFAF